MDNKYCQTCNAELMQTMRLCPQCGGRAFDAMPSKNPHPSTQPQSTVQSATGLGGPASNSSMAQPQQGIASNDDVGVKGWLLLLCVVLTIITPGYVFLILFSEWRDSVAFFDSIPLVRDVVLIETFSYSGIALFSMYAGWALWTRKKGAVRTAKMYLVAQCIVGISTMVILAGMINDRETTNGFAKAALNGIWHLVVWYWYLSKSKRVAATYS